LLQQQQLEEQTNLGFAPKDEKNLNVCESKGEMKNSTSRAGKKEKRRFESGL
jgi:hypothetical protein